MLILGKEYTVKIDDAITEDGADGLCRCYSNEILLNSVQNMLDRDSSKTAKQNRFKEVFRHEIIHAFFHEAGLDNYSDDEVLVQFLAFQFPKLVELFREQNILEGGEDGC